MNGSSRAPAPRDGLRARFAASRRALGGGVACVACAVLGCGDGDASPGSSARDAAGKPAPPATAPAIAPTFSRIFVETTSRAGIRFRHEAGATGEKLLPETMGPSPIVLDFDGDGAPDFYLPNGGPRPGASPRPAGPGGKLYRNRGDGTFEDATERARAALPHVYAFGGSAADYDGDGDDDLYVTALDDNVLLRNDGGVFTDVTAEAGAKGGTRRDAAGLERPEWSTAAAWFDADVDGDLDLFVANYVAWSPETEIFTSLDGVNKAFTTPDRYPGLPCRLLLNDGKGKFVDGSAAAGLLPHLGKALGVALWDFDDDGLLDVVVANDTRPNFLFRNLGGGKFEETGLAEGVAYDENGRARAGMGADVVDDLGDARTPVVAVGNFAGEPISFYRRRPEGGFRPTAAEAGLAGPTFAPLTFGLLFSDLDLDGRPDLVLANGHLEPDVQATTPDRTYAQAPLLFRGGERGYVDVSALAGPDFARPRVARGLVTADFDRDGDRDLLLTTNGVLPEYGAAVLLENRPRDPSLPPPHRLRVVVRGLAPNTAAIGAKVELTALGRTRTEYVRTGSSYAGGSELALDFGLGAATGVERLRVTFPRRGDRPRTTRDVAVTQVDRVVVVTE